MCLDGATQLSCRQHEDEASAERAESQREACRPARQPPHPLQALLLCEVINPPVAYTLWGWVFCCLLPAVESVIVFLYTYL